MPKITPKVDSVLDWIEVTSGSTCVSEAQLKERAAKATHTDPVDWRTDQAFNRYSVCVRHSMSGALALCGRADMGTHLIFGGTALTEFRKAGIGSVTLLASVLDAGYHGTRLDLAIDAINSRIDGRQTLADFHAKRALTRANSINMLVSPNDGWTIYIGARSSDKHMRIYNKAAEVENKALVPDGVDDWIRFELIMKRENARHASRVIEALGLPEAVRSFIAEYATNPSDPRWVRVMEGHISEVGLSVRKMTDTRKWLIRVAAKTLARELQSDPSIYLDFLEAVQNHFEWFEARAENKRQGIDK